MPVREHSEIALAVRDAGGGRSATSGEHDVDLIPSGGRKLGPIDWISFTELPARKPWRRRITGRRHEVRSGHSVIIAVRRLTLDGADLTFRSSDPSYLMRVSWVVVVRRATKRSSQRGGRCRTRSQQ